MKKDVFKDFQVLYFGIKDFALFLLILTVLTLSFIAYSQHIQIVSANANASIILETKMFDLQARCSKQAKETYNDETYKASGWQSGGEDFYTDHYNVALNKCFMLIQRFDAVSYPPEILTMESLLDVFSMKDYGDYHEIDHFNQSTKPSIICTVFHADGTKSHCLSKNEFKAAADYFMGFDS